MKTCAAEGCERNDIHGHDLCRMHYLQKRRSGDLKTKSESCNIDNCDGSVVARGWCNKHYQRWLKHGDPRKVMPPKANNKLQPGIASFRYLMRNYQGTAKRKGLEWSLNEYEFRFFTESNCHYCGKPPGQVFHNNYGDSYTYTGVDRIDNEHGYTWENCVPACTVCNIRKRAMTYEGFRRWILLVAATMPDKPEQKEIWECT